MPNDRDDQERGFFDGLFERVVPYSYLCGALGLLLAVVVMAIIALATSPFGHHQ